MDISHFGPLPAIQTRKALLLLDFQNDFIRPHGALHVPNSADFLDTLPQLAQAFRHVGDVFWIRSLYRSRRSPFDPSTGNRLILGGPVEEERKRQLPQEEPDEDPADEEAFLSTDTPKCCVPQSHGSKFPAPIVAAIDHGTDKLWDKYDYSALQDDNLLVAFRTSLITEVYLCGTLSNVSVYATALDAARYGFSVTVVEDCLGFRHFGRHEEAMRQMADVLGAAGITSDELYQEIDWDETDDIAQKGDPRPARSVTPAGIEGVLHELDVRKNHNSHDQRNDPGRILADRADDEDGDQSEPAKSIRPHYAPSPANSSAVHGTGDENSTKARAPRMKRNERKAKPSRTKNRRGRSRQSQDLRPGDFIGEGDSRIVYDLDIPEDAFKAIHDEVAWQKMYHMSGQVPRLVAVQGRPLPDGSVPIYRHPADESPPLRPFTSTVDQIRAIVERILGHPLNHVLIQLYRDGQDRISEHADKTLDIVRGSFICNVSLGAQRVMVLRTKTQKSGEEDPVRQMQRVPLPHESLFVLGENTNMRWLHGIRPDKRPVSEKSVEDRSYGGQRISLTFRHIGTFLASAGDTIWGQGAVSETQGRAGNVIHGDPAETERLIRAFGQENHATEFDWDAVYGSGFDVVNFVTAETARLILSGDPVSDLRVRLSLGENGHRYEVTDAKLSDEADTERPLYIGPDGTKVAGVVKILTYLAERPAQARGPGADTLQGGTELQRVEELLEDWRNFQGDGDGEFESLGAWETALSGRQYLGGTVFNIDDCSLWPVLREIVQRNGTISKRFPNLRQYYQRVENRGVVKVTLEESG